MVTEAHHFDGRCPICGTGMLVTRLSCPACGSSLEGAFQLEGASAAGAPGGDDGAARFGRLARLDDAQLEFVEVFVRCRGIIKTVEDMLGISYPTVRARLASVLETMGFGADEELPPAEQRRTHREILANLKAGRISTEEALRLLPRDAAAEMGEG